MKDDNQIMKEIACWNAYLEIFSDCLSLPISEILKYQEVQS